MLVLVGRELSHGLELADGLQPPGQRAAMRGLPSIDRDGHLSADKQRQADDAKVRVVLVLLEHRDKRLEPRDAAGWRLAVGDKPMVNAREPG